MSKSDGIDVSASDTKIMSTACPSMLNFTTGVYASGTADNMLTSTRFFIARQKLLKKSLRRTNEGATHNTSTSASGVCTPNRVLPNMRK